MHEAKGDRPAGRQFTVKQEGATIEELIFELNETAGTTLMVVTHNLELASRTGRVIKLRGGEIVSDETTASLSAM